jgi:integral membrane protein
MMLHKFETNAVFSDSEAWLLFRLAAFGEALGWTMLISGILCERYFHTRVPVILAGRTHGVLFLLYAVAALGLYPALRWSRKFAVIAVLASVPPYGTLVVEQWTSYRRHTAHASTYHRWMTYHYVASKAALAA